MIRLDQYGFIRTAHRVYGKSIREIAGETGHSRNTIRKILRDEHQEYRQREQQSFPVLGKYLSIIDRWPEEDREQPKKQRHTARRIFNRLRNEEGYTGSGATVRRYVREARIRPGIGRREAFIPSEPLRGQEAGTDWGTARAVPGGEETRIKFFCMRSKYSGRHFVRCYPCERQEALSDAHIRAFSYYGGVFPVLIYDNMTTAVRRVFQGKGRELQVSYAKFQAYYNFTPRFCNTGKGHEKGGVEGLAGYARRNYPVPVPRADSLEVLNDRILRECLTYGTHRISGREQTVNALFEEEKASLISLPSQPFANIRTFERKADKYATVIADKNRYSIPSRYAGVQVRVVLSIDRVDVYRTGRKPASHSRLFGNNKWCPDPDHYLELVQQRPQAFDSARPIRELREQWPSGLKKLLERFCQKQGHTKGVRDFITVLMFYREHPAEDIHAAVDLALETGISESQGVRHILLHTGPDRIMPPLENQPTLPKPDLSVYECLGGDR